jgi:hypothetical protein
MAQATLSYNEYGLTEQKAKARGRRIAVNIAKLPELLRSQPHWR